LYQEFNKILNNGILLSKEAIAAIKSGSHCANTYTKLGARVAQ
jgi:hypothetical protein